jgi:hypothetical protein
MFKATSSVKEIIDVDNSFTVDRWCEVETPNGWIFADKLNIGDKLFISDDDLKSRVIITDIKFTDNEIIIRFKGVVE